jgi:hypothetical protein
MRRLFEALTTEQSSFILLKELDNNKSKAALDIYSSRLLFSKCTLVVTKFAINAALEQTPPSNKRRAMSPRNLINAAAFIRIITVYQ